MRTNSLALLAAASLMVAAPASAKTVSNANIRAGNGSFFCFALNENLETVDGSPLPSGIECMSRFLPKGKFTDSFFELLAEGKASKGERGDYPGYNVRAIKVRRGDVWRRPGIECKVLAKGLRCRNQVGAGFLIAPRKSALY